MGGSEAAPLLEVLNHSAGWPGAAPDDFLEVLVAALRRHVGRPDLRVSLLLTDDAEIAQLHGEFLGDPTPTDVMSFDLDGDAELVVSVETAAREAGEDVPVHWEVGLYVVHGLLHLCGYDDHGAAPRDAMRRAERDVLHAVGVRVRDVDGAH